MGADELMANATTVVVVSGGSRGLGQALVEAFLAQPGHVVATFSRSKTDFTEQLQRNAMLAGRFHFEEVDMRDKEGLRSFVERVYSLFGRVDILVNNASIARDGMLATFHDDDIDAIVDIDVKGTLCLTKHCVRRMLLGSGGRVITISSIVGQSGYRGLSVYSAAKAALDGFTRSLARELGPRGIAVNSVAPGFIRSEMTKTLGDDQVRQIERRTPIGRLATAADIIPLVLFLASPDARFITGQTIVVDGGLTI